MVKGLPKIKANAKPSPFRYSVAVTTCAVFAIVGGYLAATQPTGAGWRDPFSYHPLLMTAGYVGFMCTAVVTKKLGGYANTKYHAILSTIGLLCTYGGFYAIYLNKNKYSKPHFTSTHSRFGLATLFLSTIIMSVGSIYLHPDWGLDKSNKAFRFWHHWIGKMMLILALYTCFSGLMQLTSDGTIWAAFGLPLLAFIPLAIL